MYFKYYNLYKAFTSKNTKKNNINLSRVQLTVIYKLVV